jgi:hypothetical protein
MSYAYANIYKALTLTHVTNNYDHEPFQKGYFRLRDLMNPDVSPLDSSISENLKGIMDIDSSLDFSLM